MHGDMNFYLVCFVNLFIYIFEVFISFCAHQLYSSTTKIIFFRYQKHVETLVGKMREGANTDNCWYRWNTRCLFENFLFVSFLFFFIVSHSDILTERSRQLASTYHQSHTFEGSDRSKRAYLQLGGIGCFWALNSLSLFFFLLCMWREKVYQYRHLKRVSTQRRHLLAQWKAVFLSHYALKRLSLSSLSSNLSRPPPVLDSFLETCCPPHQGLSGLRGSVIKALANDATYTANAALATSPRFPFSLHCPIYQSRIRLPIFRNTLLLLPPGIALQQEKSAWFALETSLKLFLTHPAAWRGIVESTVNSSVFLQLHRMYHTVYGDEVPSPVPPQLCFDVHFAEQHPLGRPRPASPGSSSPAPSLVVTLIAHLPPLQGEACETPGFCLARCTTSDLSKGMKEVTAAGLALLRRNMAAKKTANKEEMNTLPAPRSTSVPGPVRAVHPDDVSSAVHRAQNRFYVPDVSMMWRELETITGASVSLEWAQTAPHQPLKCLRRLQAGYYGDVVMDTRLSVRVDRPRGVGVASYTVESRASSEAVDHHAESPPLGDGESIRREVEREARGRALGHLRGPLPLLIEAITRLYIDVVLGEPSAVHHGTDGSSPNTALQQLYTRYAGRLPLLAVQHPTSAEGLAFLLYAWCGSPVQIRCFQIQPRRDRHQYLYRGRRYDMMTRALCIFDVFGQRLLFGESHHWDARRAVQRAQTLALALNLPRQEVVLQAHRWQPKREGEAGGSTASRLPPPTHRSCRKLGDLKYQTSRCSALKLVVSNGLRLYARSKHARKKKEVRGEGPAASSGGCSETMLPVALRPSASPSSLAARTARSRITPQVGARRTKQLFRYWIRRQPSKLCALLCLLEALGTVKLRCVEDTAHEAESGAWTGVAELQWRCGSLKSFTAKGDATGETSGDNAPTILRQYVSRKEGILPTITALCEQALTLAYRFLPLSECFLPLSRLRYVLEEAEPLLPNTLLPPEWAQHRSHKLFPPYDPCFYFPPNLLNEVLQGICGKYSATYALLSPTTVRSSEAKEKASVLRGTWYEQHEARGISETPDPVFYARAVPPSLLGRGNQDIQTGRAPFRRHDAQGETEEDCREPTPLRVCCRLHIACLAGTYYNGVASKAYGDDSEIFEPFYIGVGEGGSKREAWRVAALNALRTNFPQVFCQLDPWRDSCDVRRNLMRWSLDTDGLQWRWGRPTELVPSCSSSSSTAAASAWLSPSQRQFSCSVEVSSHQGGKTTLKGYGTNPGLAFVEAVSALKEKLSTMARSASSTAEAAGLSRDEGGGEHSMARYASWWGAEKSVVHVQCAIRTVQKKMNATGNASEGRLQWKFVLQSAITSPSSTFRRWLSQVPSPSSPASTPLVSDEAAAEGLIAVLVHQTWTTSSTLYHSAHAVRAAFEPLVKVPLRVQEEPRANDNISTAPHSVAQDAICSSLSTIDNELRVVHGCSRCALLWCCMQEGLRVFDAAEGPAAWRVSCAERLLLKRLWMTQLGDERESRRVASLPRAEKLLGRVFGFPVRSFIRPLYASSCSSSKKLVSEAKDPSEEGAAYVSSGWRGKLVLRLPKLASPFKDPTEPEHLWWTLCEIETTNASSHAVAAALSREAEAFFTVFVLPAQSSDKFWGLEGRSEGYRR